MFAIFCSQDQSYSIPYICISCTFKLGTQICHSYDFLHDQLEITPTSTVFTKQETLLQSGLEITQKEPVLFAFIFKSTSHHRTNVQIAGIKSEGEWKEHSISQHIKTFATTHFCRLHAYLGVQGYATFYSMTKSPRDLCPRNVLRKMPPVQHAFYARFLISDYDYNIRYGRRRKNIVTNSTMTRTFQPHSLPAMSSLGHLFFVPCLFPNCIMLFPSVLLFLHGGRL